MMNKNITVSWDVSEYNGRRYGRPWGARIKFNGVKAEYDFSHTAYHGDTSGGRVIIQCNSGDIVAFGQKDNYKKLRIRNSWYIVNSDGSTTEIDRAGAYDHWIASHR
jgi:hypothetical protein